MTDGEDKKRVERIYTTEQREQGIATVFLLGSYTLASEKTGIPEATLRGWVKALQQTDSMEIRAATRARVIETAWAATFSCLQRAYSASTKIKSRADYDEKQAGALAEIAERISRVLKNIGAVEQRIQLAGDADKPLVISLVEAQKPGVGTP